MFERIVLGWQPEPAARSALDWALDQAKPGAGVELVHVADEMEMDPHALTPDKLRIRAQLYAEATRQGALHPGLHVRGVFVVGDPEQVLVRRSGDGELLVVGMPRARQGRHAGLATRLARRSDRSVAVIPAARPIGPVFVGIGPATPPEVAVVGAEIAAGSDSELILLRADGFRGTAGATPTALVERVHDARPEVSVRVVLTSRSVYDALAQAGEEASVLVVGPRLTESGAREAAVHLVPCPLLLLGSSTAAASGTPPRSTSTSV